MESSKTKVPLTSEQQMNQFRFRDKMSVLNAEFILVLNKYHKEKPTCDFTATLKSYMDNVVALKTMYKMEDPLKNGNENSSSPRTVIQSEKVDNPAVEGRKIARARRKNDTSTPKEKLTLTATKTTPAPSAFAASSPAVASSIPKISFGDISMIPVETPAPIEKAKKADEPAPQPARKRAIRGGGPLGGSESVVFKSGKGERVSVSEVQIPVPTIKFPEPSKDFWTKKAPTGEDANKPSGSLFAFLGNTDSTSSPAKFTGFSFGKKPDDQENEKSTPKTGLSLKNKDEEKKTPSTPSIFSASSTSPFAKKEEGNSKPAATPSFPSFGSTSSPNLDKKDNSENSKPALSFPSFGATPTLDSAKKDASESSKPALSFPSFGAPAAEKNSNGDAPKISLSFPSFGSSTGSSVLTAPSSTGGGLTFGSGGSLFANLSQKASENAANAAEGNDDEGEYVPPKVEAVENEEPDAIFSKKVSVFKYNGKDYQKLGVGMLHIKESGGKNSVLIRAATTTGTVWLNAGCSPAMKATKVDEKGEKYRLSCPLSSSEIGTFLIRFGVAEQATEFANKIKELAK